MNGHGSLTREVPYTWPGHNFVSSPRNPRGLHLRFWVADDVCFTRCALPDYLCGLDGVVHGGILGMVMDEVAAWTIITQLARLGITTEMTLRYLKPVPTGVELVVEGRVVSHDQRSAVIRTTLALEQTQHVESESHWRLPPLHTVAIAAGMEAAEMERFLAVASGRQVL